MSHSGMRKGGMNSFPEGAKDDQESSHYFIDDEAWGRRQGSEVRV